jgi:hypothetical protein
MADQKALYRKVRQIMKDDRLLFIYRGAVTGPNSVSLLFLLEKDMLNSEFSLTGRKRLFMFVLESLQNVSRHMDLSEHANMSLVVYSRNESGYTVTTGNVIHRDEEAGLREQLVFLNGLEKEELRELYREKLGSNNLSEKGGAGLGLIEMAKRTGNKLDFDFIKIGDELLYFIISKSVDTSGQSMNRGQEKLIFKGDNIMRLEKMMAENDILSVWSGHLTSDIEKQVLSFTETRMNEEDLALAAQRKIFNIMVECLQNISKYNPGPEIERELGLPVAMMVLEDNGVKITTGNIISNNSIPRLRAKLETVNSYDRKGLKELYRITLSGDKLNAEKTGILGLIDIARKSRNKLDYDFDRVNEDYSYYSLSVLVDINHN